MKVFTAPQMREFDRVASEEYGIPSIVLMENAALRVVEFLEAKFAPLQDKRVVILCGKGNNGGDGLAIARHLIGRVRRLVVMHTDWDSYKGDAAINAKILQNAKGDIELSDWTQFLIEEDTDSFSNNFGVFDIGIDALFGTGFKGEITSDVSFLLQTFEGLPCRVSVDILSGLNADTSDYNNDENGSGGKADYTISFAAPKRGLFIKNGLDQSGEIWIGEIGSIPHQMENTETGTETLDLEYAQATIPNRTIDAHKGDAGRTLIIGGSFGMSGAVALSAKASLKIGAGLCIAAIPEKILPIFASSILEATSHPLPCSEKGFLLEAAADELAELWKNVNVVALGPGIGRTPETQKFVARVVRECPKPLIIDADALHALPAIADEVKNREAETILTPHPGEMGALMNISAKEVNETRFEIAEACAEKYGAIVVLKGARSLVATPEGQTFVNLTGNAGMATGGSGDVLTGTIAGLLAQIKHAEDATKLGVYIHGYAGDMAFKTLGNGLTAVDILEHLPLALEEIKGRSAERINGRLRKLE
jgi:hydroxyethylthiazole kinase-like uncharacterized protein yjeF